MDLAFSFSTIVNIYSTYIHIYIYFYHSAIVALVLSILCPGASAPSVCPYPLTAIACHFGHCPAALWIISVMDVLHGILLPPFPCHQRPCGLASAQISITLTHLSALTHRIPATHGTQWQSHISVLSSRELVILPVQSDTLHVGFLFPETSTS